MIEVKIWMALKRHALARVPFQLVMPTDTFELDVTKEVVLVSFIPNISIRYNMENDSEHYYDGILQLTLMSPLNRNQENIVNKASMIIGAFLEGDRIFFDDVRVYIPKRGDMTQTYRDAGMWRTPINIRYRAWGQAGAFVPFGDLDLRQTIALLDNEGGE